MEEDKPKKDLPPYVSYRTFKHWLEGRRSGLPDKIDRAILGNLAGVVQGQLISTLRFLRLISANGEVAPALEKLVHAEGEERSRMLGEILKSAYGFLFDGSINLAKAAPSTISTAFTSQGVTGDTARKAISFFVLAAKDAGIPISPFLKTPRAPRGLSQKKRTPRTENDPNGDDNGGAGGNEPSAQVKSSLMKELLSKFPALDPAWPDDVKAKWFEAFDRLMNSIQEGEGKKQKSEAVSE
jgi:hypothetical protein